MTYPLPGVLSADTTLGAVYLGVVFGIFLFGLTVYQAYKYFTVYYATDRTLIKRTIITIVSLETLHSVLWIIICYHYLVTEAFNLIGLCEIHWSVRLIIIVTGFTVAVPQAFYARRVYLLGPRYRWLAVLGAILTVSGLAFAIADGVRSYISVRYITDLRRVSWMVSAAYGSVVGADIVLTGALLYILHSSRTGSIRGDTVISMLMKYTINTGLLTSVFSVLAFIFAIILPGNLVYAGISIVGAKIYANSVLAVVNSRKEFRAGFYKDDFTLPDLQVSVAQVEPGPGLVPGGQRRALHMIESLNLSFGALMSHTEPDSSSLADAELSVDQPSPIPSCKPLDNGREEAKAGQNDSFN